MAFHKPHFQEIINLNVGGKRFSTSWQTLMWVPDTFFTALLSGQIPSLRDESGAIFIDRDPKTFSYILNYLRTKSVDLTQINVRTLKHEADYFGIVPLSRRLALCSETSQLSCGGLLYHGYLPPPDNLFFGTPLPSGSASNTVSSRKAGQCLAMESRKGNYRNVSVDLCACNTRLQTANSLSYQREQSRAEPLDIHNCPPEHSQFTARSGILPEFGFPCKQWSEQLKVQIIKTHYNWLVIAYMHFFVCYRLTDTYGWCMLYQSTSQEAVIERLAINAKTPCASLGELLVGTSSGNLVRLISIVGHCSKCQPTEKTLIGSFDLGVFAEELMFVGHHLVALSMSAGKAGVWHTSSQHWQVQDVSPLTSYDIASSLLVLGTATGCINFIDMEKFPLRMKDNDLLVPQLYRDPGDEPITAISVYLTPKKGRSGNWIEIAYGTQGGTVRVVVHHPETVGHGPQLFQTFTVHQSPITKIKLSEKYLVAVCSDYNHVRSWKMTRFRGMISTKPGTTPEFSFNIMQLDSSQGCDCGPYGEQDDELIFVQKVVPEADTLYVRLASNGNRVCRVKSVDGSGVSSFTVAEFDMAAVRPRRLLISGHRSGAAQMWDITHSLAEALLCCAGKEQSSGGPSDDELVHLLEQVDLETNI